jgi:hypothetical protein
MAHQIFFAQLPPSISGQQAPAKRWIKKSKKISLQQRYALAN